MVENSAKDHHELFYYDDPQPTSESLNETPFDSSRFELVQSSDPAIELVSEELNHLAAILHVYAGGLNFMK